MVLQYQFLQGTENRHQDARTEYTFLSLCEFFFFFFHEKTDKMWKYWKSAIFVWYENGRRRLLGAQSINTERASLRLPSPRRSHKTNNWVQTIYHTEQPNEQERNEQTKAKKSKETRNQKKGKKIVTKNSEKIKMLSRKKKSTKDTNKNKKRTEKWIKQRNYSLNSKTNLFRWNYFSNSEIKSGGIHFPRSICSSSCSTPSCLCWE